jgi:hypothetical protein
LNVAGIVLLTFLLFSQIILPPQNRSNYLGICLTASALIMSVGFVVPLATKSNQCYDAITPNDMYSSTACFLTGALVINGTLSVLSWILVRAVSMHLQVCWNVVPGSRFFWGSQVAAWGVPIIFANLTLFLSGVSYRFGNVCYLNHQNAMVFWSPMIAVGGAAFLLQIFTFFHCARIFLTTARHGVSATNGSSTLEDIRSTYIPNVYRRIRAVCLLQWRSMALVTVVLLELSLFTILIFFLDRVQQFLREVPAQVGPWVLCMMDHPTNKYQCMHLMDGIIVRESVPDAAIILFSLVGIAIFILLVPPSLFSAWRAYFSPSSITTTANAGKPSNPFPDTKPQFLNSRFSAPPTRRHTDFIPSGHKSSASIVTRPEPSHNHTRSYSSTSTTTTTTTDSARTSKHVCTQTKPSLFSLSDTSSMTEICLDTTAVTATMELEARRLQSPSGPRSVFDWSSPVERRGRYPWEKKQ